MSSKNLPSWDLSGLCKNPEHLIDVERWSEVLTLCERLLTQITNLGEMMGYGELKEWLDELDVVARLAYKARVYAYLQFAAETQKEGVGVFLQTVNERVSKVEARIGEMMSVLAQMPASYLEGAQAYPGLSVYKAFLGRLLQERDHILSPSDEKKWIERSVTARDSWQRFAEESSSRVRIILNGKETSFDAAWNQIRSSSEAERKDAMQGVMLALKDEQFGMGMAYNAILKDCSISNEWRSFQEVDASRHLSNETNALWVDALRSVVQESYEKTSHVLNKLRARQRGDKSLEIWNASAPLVSSQESVSFEQAFDWVHKAYQEFDPVMGDMVLRLRDEQRLDMALRPSKVGGAFCYMSSENGPYVLCNYYGRIRDVLVLAHEVGHAIHSMLCQGLPVITASTTLILSEIASLFSERLCINYILKQDINADLKKEVFSSYVQDQVGCVQGSVNCDKFEKLMHEMRESSEVSQEIFAREWVRVRQEYFGDNVVVPEEYGFLWCVVPHFFHTPFYVYAYAFSSLCMQQIYDKKEEDGFMERYRAFLQQGGGITFEGVRQHFNLPEDPYVFFKNAMQHMYADVSKLESMFQ